MAGDPRLDRPGPVLFGGYGAAGSCGGPHNDCSDTWQWHGGAWEQRQPAQVPPARYDAALAAAGGAAGGGILLFGGMHLDPDGFGGVVSSRLGDTWVFDGDDWSEHDPARSPAPRCCAGAAWDAGRDRTVLYGGRADRATDCGGLEEECGDTWEWAGDAWEPRTPLVAPPPLEYPALAWDPDRRGVVLHGGQSTRDGPANGDDWPRSGFSWLYSPERTTPHLLAAFDVGGSGLLAQTAANPADTVLTAVEVSARAGGLGHTPGSREGGGGEPVAGYLLAVGAMGTGGWLPVREADDRPDEGEAWTGVFDRTWSCGEPWCADASIQRWAESDGMLYLDFATRAPQGAVPEPAVVAVDLVEVRLRAWRTGCELAGAHHPEGTPNGAPCDDDDPATAGEVCREGRCVVP